MVKRQSDNAETVLPDVICSPEMPSEKIGVFGNFGSVKFDFTQTGRRVSRVAAQGLIRGDGADITAECVADDGSIVLNGELINRIFKTEDSSEMEITLVVEF